MENFGQKKFCVLTLTTSAHQSFLSFVISFFSCNFCAPWCVCVVVVRSPPPRGGGGHLATVPQEVGGQEDKGSGGGGGEVRHMNLPIAQQQSATPKLIFMPSVPLTVWCFF